MFETNSPADHFRDAITKAEDARLVHELRNAVSLAEFIYGTQGIVRTEENTETLKALYASLPGYTKTDVDRRFELVQRQYGFEAPVLTYSVLAAA